jgi:hypothetical protein
LSPLRRRVSSPARCRRAHDDHGRGALRTQPPHAGGDVLDEVAPTARAAAAAIEKGIADLTTLDRAATLADVGNVAVFAASHWAQAPATKLNITGGTVPD